ncbi:MAG: SDR family oxidoreductase [Myxococcota bacterium]|nr:SDR family oxidoreductase [Myxococcota bacterium]
MTDETVLITGCSTGIGKLAAQTFHAKGWNVVATLRTPEKEKQLSELDGVLVTRLDVTDKASIQAAVSEALERFGGIDVVVNNAARGGHALLEASSDEMVRAMFDTNVFGVMDVCRTVLPHMRERGTGCIINVTSMAGMLGLPLETSYSATKYAVEGMTEALAFEIKGFGLSAKTVAPGAYMRTEFSSNANDADFEAGGPELTAHANSLLAHFRSSVSSEGGDTADPQEVADKIFECATTETPVHNPVGKDAELLISMMGGPGRQAFIDKVEPLLLPSA